MRPGFDARGWSLLWPEWLAVVRGNEVLACIVLPGRKDQKMLK